MRKGEWVVVYYLQDISLLPVIWVNELFDRIKIDQMINETLTVHWHLKMLKITCDDKITDDLRSESSAKENCKQISDRFLKCKLFSNCFLIRR